MKKLNYKIILIKGLLFFIGFCIALLYIFAIEMTFDDFCRYGSSINYPIFESFKFFLIFLILTLPITLILFLLFFFLNGKNIKMTKKQIIFLFLGFLFPIFIFFGSHLFLEITNGDFRIIWGSSADCAPKFLNYPK